ncbi:MAG: hypothetical protein CO098_07870, partial [Bacteroidetes bacterium CG_4_9_14_3_um_filter_41_19]
RMWIICYGNGILFYDCVIMILTFVVNFKNMKKEDIENRVLEILKKVLGLINETSKHLNKQDIETWDSLKHIMIIAEIEMEFDIQFEPEEIVEMDSSGEIVRVITKKQ